MKLPISNQKGFTFVHIFAFLSCMLPVWAFAQKDSFYETKMLAEWGKTTTQFKLGLMYYKGQGVEQNYLEALKWFGRAAQKGLPEAQYYFGLMYYEGKGAHQNYTKALNCFHIAAKRGQAEAQFILGEMYVSGKGVSKNYSKAYAWTSIALTNGYELAKQNLIFLNNAMTASELEKAVKETVRLRESLKNNM